MRSMKSGLGVVAMAVMLGACGSTADSSVGSGTPNPGGPGIVPRTNPPSGANFHEVGVEARVANFYIPKGSTSGAPIDVWAGNPGQVGSRKLGTVEYGKLSPPLRPTARNVPGQAAGKHDSYVLTFYPAGKTGMTDKLNEQSETASPHQKLVAVLVPGDPRFDGAANQMLFDEVGDDPPPSYKQGHFPTGTAGKVLVDVNATATQYLGTDSGAGPTFVAGTPGKGCAPYYSSFPDPKLHTYSEHGVDLVGGTGSLVYEVDPGSALAVYMIGRQQDPTSACQTNSPLGPVDLGLAAGGRAHVFVFGETLSALKLLVVPA